MEPTGTMQINLLRTGDVQMVFNNFDSLNYETIHWRKCAICTGSWPQNDNHNVRQNGNQDKHIRI